ncbi:MAG: hypothetical protein P8J17_06490 [Halioglobus sp.]|nr:hypothetical protein [Halioglobus sp.]
MTVSLRVKNAVLMAAVIGTLGACSDNNNNNNFGQNDQSDVPVEPVGNGAASLFKQYLYLAYVRVGGCPFRCLIKSAGIGPSVS